jgi:hypothetical protein
MALVFFYHGRNTHDAHDQKNSKENHRDYKDRHCTPLCGLSFVDEPATVTAITGRCEERDAGTAVAQRTATKRVEYRSV